MIYINAKKLYIKKKVILWTKENFEPFPWRFSKNKWHSLAVEIMLQRTKAQQVLAVYTSFCLKYSMPLDYFKDSNSKVFNTLGLMWREKELKRLAEYLIDNEIPEDKKSLLNLPGVGEYVAAAYRSLHIGQRDTIIDSNIVRLYGRYFGFETDAETRRKKWFIELAESLTPKRNFKKYNYGLLDFTRAICKPKPLCDLCPLKRNCEYYLHNKLINFNVLHD